MPRYIVKQLEDKKIEIKCPTGVKIITDRKIYRRFNLVFYSDYRDPWYYFFKPKNKEDLVTLKCLAKLSGCAVTDGNYFLLFSRPISIKSIQRCSFINYKTFKKIGRGAEFLSVEDVIYFINNNDITWD